MIGWLAIGTATWGALAFGAVYPWAWWPLEDDAITYWLRAGAVMGLVAIALQEFVEFSLQIRGNAVLFTVVAAISLHRPPAHRRG